MEYTGLSSRKIGMFLCGQKASSSKIPRGTLSTSCLCTRLSGRSIYKWLCVGYRDISSFSWMNLIYGIFCNGDRNCVQLDRADLFLVINAAVSVKSVD